MVIELADTLQALACVVDEHGAEHRHRARWHPTLRRRSWRHQVDGRPACIVGVVLSRFGVGAADLDTLGERSVREFYRNDAGCNGSGLDDSARPWRSSM